MKSIRNVLLICAILMPPVLAAEEPAEMPRSAAPEGVTLEFANLSDGDVVPPTFEVNFVVNGMTVLPAGTEGEHSGHHHLLIDVGEMPPMNLPLPKTDNIVHFGDGASGANVTLPPGDHTLQLLFADHRHIPHDPPVMSEKITVTVSHDAY